ncbi:MAG TPA: terminase large subunit, partial [Xanthobacteraceae bacterium]|nr:terminase large subunit [Xanthobacteraceae bacterium]
MPPLPWLDSAEAGRAVAIFDKLRLPDVIGRPALADAAGDWFRNIVRALMGSVEDDGERQVREVFCLTPKKQSKTTYGAALMVTALLMNRRPRAEFLLIGPTKITADLAFDQAAGMIEADPDGFLQKRMFVQEHLKTITDRRTKAQLLIKTFDAKVLTGVKPAGVLLDELHEISKSARAARVIGQIRGGMLPIPESFLVFITTQSDERPEGAFLAELQMARDIRDGRAAGAMLPILYEFPRDIMTGSGWSDPANWPMVMPNLGRSVTLARLEDEFATAKLKGNAELRRWASQHLNVEVGLALRSDRWAGADYWSGRVEPGLTLDRLLDRCEVVVVGVDGGGLDDLFGLTVLGRERQESDVDEGEGEIRRVHRWLSWSHAWCHEGVLDRRMSIAAVLQDFADAGELTIVDDELADLSAIVAHIEAIKDRGLLAC